LPPNPCLEEEEDHGYPNPYKTEKYGGMGCELHTTCWEYVTSSTKG